MQTDTRSWIPTSPRERVFLFSLAIALMLNTTVVMLLFAGDLPVLGDLLDNASPAVAEQQVQDEPAGDSQPIDPADQTPRADASEPVLPEPAEQRLAEVVPAVEEVPTHSPLVSVQPATTSTEPTKPAQHAQPKQDEPSVTFFGVGLD